MPTDVINADNSVVYTHTAHILYDMLDKIRTNLCFALEKKGIHAVPVPTDVPYLHWDEQAIADFSKSIEIEPKSFAYNYRVVTYKNLGEYEKAMADYNKAKDLKSRETNAFNNFRIYKAKLIKEKGG
jgi:tetratricopeptide (TPR) repeat protein